MKHFHAIRIAARVVQLAHHAMVVACCLVALHLRADCEWQFSSIAGTLYGLAYDGGRFVAVGHEGVVATSTTGHDWDVTRLAGPSTFSLRDVAYGKGLFV